MTGAAKALFWKISETQNFTYLTISKHQNTKTSLNKLSKNHGVIAIFEIFGSIRRKLQFTVFNDHPVVHGIAWYFMVLHCIAWYYMVLHGIAWYCVVLHGFTWYCMVLHGIACNCMVLHGIAW